MTPDYYMLLGVAPGAEDELIRTAYLALAKRYHPDTAAAASPHNVEQFQLIAEAYEVLRDPRRRAYYDWCHARQEQNSAQQIQGERSQGEHEHGEVRAPAKSTWLSAIDNPLVYSAGTVALVVALLFGLIKVIVPNVPDANTDAAMRTEKFEGSSSFLSDKAALQELTDLRRTLQQTKRLAAANQEALAQERVRSQELEKQLAARGDGDKLLAQERARIQNLEKQLAARGDSDKLLAQERTRIQELEKQLAARSDSEKLLVRERARIQELEKQQLAARSDSDKLLAQERSRSQDLEKQLAARGDNDKLLAQERARSQEFEMQLATRQHATRAHGQNVIASLLDTSHPTPPPTNESATPPLPRSDKPVIRAVDNPATLAARPEAPGNPEAARLMARAQVLLGQGNIGVARRVLERAAEMGSAPALFTLAETYDPAILSAWGTLGTQGDVGKAQELYAKAFASGVRQAKDRLNTLRY
jgi:curved DNA-binding protein CbpA